MISRKLPLAAILMLASLLVTGCESVPKWRYIKSPDHDDKTMNIFGAGGWEFVGIDPKDEKFIYKRRVESGSSLP